MDPVVAANMAYNERIQAVEENHQGAIRVAVAKCKAASALAVAKAYAAKAKAYAKAKAPAVPPFDPQLHLPFSILGDLREQSNALAARPRPEPVNVQEEIRVVNNAILDSEAQMRLCERGLKRLRGEQMHAVDRVSATRRHLELVEVVTTQGDNNTRRILHGPTG